ncbi:MAG TPA: methyltransferase domain-containing protein, partial [Desulfobacterales bacterium]|nr:methyltransferase domain-containing protein [Desulfobacterales bacterium]
MGNIEFIEWIAKDFRERRGRDFFSDTQRNFDKEEICGLFVNDSFNMKCTTVFSGQVTTDTECGIYQSLNHPHVFIDGARSLDYRLTALDKIEFQKGEKVLDVGCNMGLLAHYLYDRGCEVTAIDMDKNIILAAKMAANILNKKIDFRYGDMDENPPTELFDTICLFSVLHHLQNLSKAGKYISTHCNRIILESRQVEGGSKPVHGKWTPTSGWNFKTSNEMIAAMEKLFVGFRFENSYGKVDRDRLILSFINHKSHERTHVNVSQTAPLRDGITKKKRVDYFLIWGHGRQYTPQILNIIRSVKDLQIITIVKKHIGDIQKFVQDIYSCDTVPFRHLVDKTRYLLNTKPEIIFILVENNNPREKFFGEGAFRHIQCALVKDIKEEIRNKFNPRVNGKRTEDHVIHASDYESQVEHVLKVLGLPPVEFYTGERNSDLDVPFHIEAFDDYLIKEVDIDNLYANILGAGIVPIIETPHYKYLTGDKAAYRIYHEKYFGEQLTEDHFPEAYDLMVADFKYDYTTRQGKRSLILAKSLGDNKYQILDGVHRAAVLKQRGVKTVTIAEPLHKVKQQHPAKSDLAGVIFSKDRAMQLQATIESFLLHCKDSDNLRLTVIYKASTPLYEHQYNDLKKSFSNIMFIRETNFRKQTLAAIGASEYVLFLVDDNIFTADFRIGDITAALRREADATGFSL